MRTVSTRGISRPRRLAFFEAPTSRDLLVAGHGRITFTFGGLRITRDALVVATLEAHPRPYTCGEWWADCSLQLSMRHGAMWAGVRAHRGAPCACLANMRER